MDKKNEKKSTAKKLFKASFITAGTAAAGCAVFGEIFIEKFLSRKGLIALASNNNMLSEEEYRMFRESPEAVASLDFFRKTAYTEVFTFNKKSECLHGIFYEAAEPTDKYVIICHGYSDLPEKEFNFNRHYHEMGYNVLAPYFGGHGESERDYCTMGWFDRLDMLCWISFILDKDPGAKIVLHGASMGGAIVSMTTGEKLPENVVCAVSDCAYTSAWDVFGAQITNLAGLPPVPFLNIINGVSKLRLGFDFKEASALEQVRKSVTPTLFIHGDKDDFVPFSMLDPLYNNASCEKQKLVIEGAKHATSAMTAPELYWNTVTEFIAKYMK